MPSAIKNLMCMKLKVIDSLTELLPKAIKGNVKELENYLITTVNALTSDYMDQKKRNENKADIKKVSIE